MATLRKENAMTILRHLEGKSRPLGKRETLLGKHGSRRRRREIVSAYLLTRGVQNNPRESAPDSVIMRDQVQQNN